MTRKVSFSHMSKTDECKNNEMILALFILLQIKFVRIWVIRYTFGFTSFLHFIFSQPLPVKCIVCDYTITAIL